MGSIDYFGGTVSFSGSDADIASMKHELEEQPKELLDQLYEPDGNLFEEGSRGEYIWFDFENKKIDLTLCNNLERRSGDFWLQELMDRFPNILFIYEQYVEQYTTEFGLYFGVFKNARNVFEKYKWYKNMDKRDRESEKYFKKCHEEWIRYDAATERENVNRTAEEWLAEIQKGDASLNDVPEALREQVKKEAGI
jgi:hypothetical protein